MKSKLNYSFIYRKKERRRLEGKMMQQSSNLSNGINSQTDLGMYNQNNQLMLKDDKCKCDFEANTH